MPSPSDWKPLGSIDPTALVDARLQAHHAAQWLARAAYAAIPKEPDDSQANLGWDPALNALVSRDFEGGFRIGIRPAELSLLWLEAGGGMATYWFDGRTDAEAGDWLAQKMKTAGLATDTLNAPLPYDMPDHPVTGGKPYDLSGAGDALREIARWFANADNALAAVAGSVDPLVKPGASPVRCWPHHFDIATVIALEEGDFETARSIGVGMSPGDDFYAEPYFYVNPWPHLDTGDLPALPAPGHWHTEGFVGAVAAGSAVVGQADQKAGLATFLQAAVAIGQDRLAA